MPSQSKVTGSHTDRPLQPLLPEIWKTSEGWPGQAAGGKFIFMLLRRWKQLYNTSLQAPVDLYPVSNGSYLTSARTISRSLQPTPKPRTAFDSHAGQTGIAAVSPHRSPLLLLTVITPRSIMWFVHWTVPWQHAAWNYSCKFPLPFVCNWVQHQVALFAAQIGIRVLPTFK